MAIGLHLQAVCITATFARAKSESKTTSGTTFYMTKNESTYQLQSQVVVHGDLDILFGAQIALGRLDRGVPEQVFDLLQIPAILTARLGAGTAEVIGAEVLDVDLLR